jgi:hypothetical protein
MEKRMAALEASIEHLKREILEQKAEIADLRTTVELGRVEISILRQLIDFLPTKTVMAFALAVTAAFIAVLLIWQPSVQAWFGITR